MLNTIILFLITIFLILIFSYIVCLYQEVCKLQRIIARTQGNKTYQVQPITQTNTLSIDNNSPPLYYKEIFK